MVRCKKTWKKDERRFERHIKPALGKRKIAEVTGADVARLHREVGEASGVYEANRTLELIRRRFGLVLDALKAHLDPLVS